MDLMGLRYAKLADGVLKFSNPAKARAKVAAVPKQMGWMAPAHGI